MQAPDLLALFVHPISGLGWPYAITGSVGSMLYGEARFTHDVDIVLRIPEGGALALRSAFPEPAFYRPPVEDIAIESARAARGHVNVIHIESGLKADLYFAGSDPLIAWALDSARTFEVAGKAIRVAPPEYIILRKLSYFREGGSEKHLRDIRGILALASPPVDRDLLERLLHEAGLADLFRQMFG